MTILNKYKTIHAGLYLRLRLLRKSFHQFWKRHILSCVGNYIREIKSEISSSSLGSTPAIILTSFTCARDLLIISKLFQDKNLTVIVPRDLTKDKAFNFFTAVNQVLYYDGKSMFHMLRSIIATLRDFNRAIIISPEATQRFASHIIIDPIIVVRIAMTANVPIIPIVLHWRNSKNLFGQMKRTCDVWIGKKNYISPKNDDFKDVFFKRRGERKFKRLNREELIEIGQRVFSKIVQAKI